MSKSWPLNWFYFVIEKPKECRLQECTSYCQSFHLQLLTKNLHNNMIMKWFSLSSVVIRLCFLFFIFLLNHDSAESSSSRAVRFSPTHSKKRVKWFLFLTAGLHIHGDEVLSLSRLWVAWVFCRQELGVEEAGDTEKKSSPKTHSTQHICGRE